MLTFLSRRLVATIIVLLAASFLVYILSANAGDPLEELRTSTAKNKEALINLRIEQLHLNVPVVLRYFLWLGGILSAFVGKFTLGTSVTGADVTSQIGSAVQVTIQLLIASTILAIVLGVLIGITSALRQYSGYDYTVTFLSFLFFSLPSFFVAVILKAYFGIAFNNFLVDPKVPIWLIVLLALIIGFLTQAIIGGRAQFRLIVFGIGAVVTFGLLLAMSLTGWLNDPSLGLPGVLVIGAGLGVLVTILTTGLGNKRALYTALTVAVLGAALFYPFNSLSERLSFWPLIGLGVLAIAVGALVGWLFGGYDRWQSARTGAVTALLSGGLIVINRFMMSWSVYSTSDIIHGRPIGTVGATTPDLRGATSSFWILGLDTFTHLLLPTISLMLISLASYSRYSRANLLDVMNQDYIRTARAKGLNERTVVMRHAFRNALIPLTTIVAFDIGGLIGGAIITETVFGWSGMGKLFNDALKAVDVNSLMGFFVVTAVVAVVFNILADLAYSALDPRIRVTV